MPIERSKRRVASARLAAAARRLLDASTLCAIATITRDGTAYINTAYFACNADLDLVWVSDPGAAHSRNIRERGTVAVAVYDSRQSWGEPDRGIQLFGVSSEVDHAEQADAQSIYASRFSDYRPDELGGYRFYVFHPCRMKLFDEHEFGAGHFVIAAVEAAGRLSWEATEIYRG